MDSQQILFDRMANLLVILGILPYGFIIGQVIYVYLLKKKFRKWVDKEIISFLYKVKKNKTIPEFKLELRKHVEGGENFIKKYLCPLYMIWILFIVIFKIESIIFSKPIYLKRLADILFILVFSAISILFILLIDIYRLRIILKEIDRVSETGILKIL